MENETGFIELTTAKGDVVPVRYSLSALRRLCKHFECKLSELSAKVQEAANDDQIELMLVLARVGAESEAALDNLPYTVTDEQILSGLSKPAVFHQLMEAFYGSFAAFSDELKPSKKADETAVKTKASKKEAGEASGEK